MKGKNENTNINKANKANKRLPYALRAWTILAVGTFLCYAPTSSAEVLSRVSVDSAGVESNGLSSGSSISADGRFVAFQSFASNLVTGDTNNRRDVFVHDTQTGVTTRVSVDSAGVESNGLSNRPSISADGRFVAFESTALNLVAGDTNGQNDIFVHDTQTGVTSRVSVDSAGVEADSSSVSASISADGRFVAFHSLATNLVTGDTNNRSDIFVHDTQTGMTSRVSVDSAGVEGNDFSFFPSISADGRFVAFESLATNLVTGDTNGQRDIFVHDTQTGVTSRVSVDSAGVEANSSSQRPSISADGRFVAFSSGATNLVVGDTNGQQDVFVHDTQTGVTSRVSVDSAGVEGDDSSFGPSTSADGRFVAFGSSATNLVTGDTNGQTDVFVHDTQTGMTTRVSVDSAGVEGDDSSTIFSSSISADGSLVVLVSGATNLVAGDTNGQIDVFLARSGFLTPNTGTPATVPVLPWFGLMMLAGLIVLLGFKFNRRN